MPFETMRGAPRRIAVIGGGISGMGAAYFLSKGHNVVLFEREGRMGGHARTVLAGKFGDQPVDTGFIVFNYVNYPHLTRLFDELNVPVTKSDMSFAASIDGGRLEYGLRTLRTLFAQKRNAVRPAYLGMVRDILKFNKYALEAADDANLTIGQLLDRLGTGEWFRDFYILPFSGAIWSTPTQKILDFPAQALVQFFKNHALMSSSGQHQWYTVDGGSIEYVKRLTAHLDATGVELRSAAPVQGVQRAANGVLVRAEGGEWEPFDDVVFATHTDTTLSLLADSSEAERVALGSIKYQPNEVVLHADETLMPKRKICWSSWNYCEEAGGSREKIDLTYWMNSLQPIPKDDPLFVTLNSTRSIREELIYDTVEFSHPVYDLVAQQGREAIRSMQGMRNTWFCGAWMKNGFHEDGLSSALDVADAIVSRDIPAKIAAA
ncbi:MAG: FAD-dependent oxidoreductase [Dinoroseobacter sp.]|nr:FAD-dependent oxidoreductase [Dinoroseobacter sp.]